MSAADLLRLAAQSPQARAFPAAKDRSDGPRDRRNTGRRGRRPTRETDPGDRPSPTEIPTASMSVLGRTVSAIPTCTTAP